MKWIRASERLPDAGGDIIFRYIGTTNNVGCGYKEYLGFCYPNMDCRKDYDKIEWLDQSEDDEWIDCTKQLPGIGGDDDAYVLIYGCKWRNIKEDIAGHCMIASWNGKDWRDTNDIFNIEDNPDYWGVTHWRPLPSSPTNTLI